MHSARVGLITLLAALTVLAVAGLASAAPAPDKDQDLRNKALKLNDVTGDYLTGGTNTAAGAGGRAKARTGIVIADFPGQRLIDAVLSQNPGVDLT